MKRLFWAAMGVALISMVFAACVEKYTIQIDATEGGTVEGHNGEYKEGETVVFTAVPADGYYFTKWSDGKTDNPRTVAVYDDLTLTAQFAQYPLITIYASDNGKVSPDVSGRYAPGSNVTITAKPDTDYFFAGWSDGNFDNPRTIFIETSNVTISAEFVDAARSIVNLGLPSGKRWARCNLGAVNPWDYGDYYAWGETQTKDNYSWNNYRYCNGDYDKLTKYNYNADCGIVDNKTTLESADDVATAVLGSDYLMPTNDDWCELSRECYWVWTETYNNHNVNGYIVYKAKSAEDKGKKVYADDTPSASYSFDDAHIFLPAAGVRDDASLYRAGAGGYYWSSSLYIPQDANYCGFYRGGIDIGQADCYERCCGVSVRPVKRP
jgi:hypothetical protein